MNFLHRLVNVLQQLARRDVVGGSGEEFPRFVEFWLAEPERSQPAVTIYALLDGPSLTGAYRFVATKKTGAIMDVEAELNFRSDIAQLGIAPLTSMYWYGENQRPNVPDWRPEIHDNDGLALWTGKGERIWRPLMNPPSVRTNSFIDENPKGFGLLQRDRDFANYQDDGAFYDKRPTMWVEPRGNWEAGAVQLVEIPTQDEIHDNIVAYWMPKRPIKAREQMSVAYRLYWQNDEPNPPTDVARVIETAKAVNIPTDQQVLHVLTQEFIVDGQEDIREPIGMSGVRLEVRVHIVSGAVSAAQNIVKCVRRCGLEVNDLVLQPLASSMAVLTQDEKELGVALVDIGGGTTDLAIYERGNLWHTAVVAVGGDHFTSDIAVGLRTPLPEAEKIKRKNGCALSSMVDEDETIEVASVGGRKPRLMARRILSEILQPRAELAPAAGGTDVAYVYRGVRANAATTRASFARYGTRLHSLAMREDALAG